MAGIEIAAPKLRVEQVMTCNVSTCDVNDSIGSVMDRMTKGKFRYMPVTTAASPAWYQSASC
jgi:CBS domain-containing protein